MSSRERLQYKRALQNLRRERLYGNPMTLEEAKSNKKKTILEQGEVLSGAAQGAAMGGLAGIPFGGPIGSAVGAGIGGLIGGYNAMQNDVPGGQASADTSSIVADAAQGNIQAFGQMITQLQQQLETARRETAAQLQQLRTEYETAKQQLEQQNQQLQQQNQQLQQQLEQVRRQLQQARRASRTATPAATPAAPEPNVINPVASVGGPKLPPPTAPGPQRITERRFLKDYL
jgi:DNA repair exonuclease SbcCD ATPase subunit